MKEYRLYYLPSWMPIVMILAIPVILGFGLVFSVTIDPESMMVMIFAIFVNAEMFLDYFTFGGIHAKDSNKMDFLITSPKGLDVLKKILMADGARRFMSGLCLYLLLIGIISDASYNFMTFCCLVLSLFVSELFLGLGRFFSSITPLFITCVASILIFSFVFFLLMEQFNIVILIVIFICYLLTAAFSRYITLQKGKRCYYDEISGENN